MGRRGEREEATAHLLRLWGQLGPAGDPLHRCALAHHLADLQDEPRDEVRWDLAALQAADQVSDARAAAAGVESPVAGFYPSLHLNLGEAYRKLGDTAAARRHLERGLAAVDALPAGGYGEMIRRGLASLAERV